MAVQLVILAGPDQGRILTVPFGKPLLIGRGRQTATCLCDLHVSRVHCRVAVEGSKLVLTHLDSSSGTFVDGQRICRHELKPGEVVQIGETRLRLHREDVASLATLPPPDVVPAPPKAATQESCPGAAPPCPLR